MDQHVTLIKSYMGNDYNFMGDWETLMPVLQKLVSNGDVFTWKICRLDGENGFSCSLNKYITHRHKDAYTCVYMAVVHELKHWEKSLQRFSRSSSGIMSKTPN